MNTILSFYQALRDRSTRSTWLLIFQLVVIFSIAFVATGCHKSKDVIPAIDTNKNALPQPVVSIDFGKLGYGNDLTGEIGNNSATRFKVIDVASLWLSSKDRIVIDKLSAQQNYIAAGENALAYAKVLSGKLKASVGLGLFKASISYFDSLSFRSDYIYAGYNLMIRQKQLKFNASADLLKNYLTPEFKADVQTQSPAFLVAHYGTSVLSNIIVGAKFEALYRSQTSASDRKTAASAGLSGALKSWFSLNVAGNGSSSSAQFNSDERLYYRTVGGNSSIALIGDIDLSAKVPTKIQLAQWQASVNTDNSELIDFGSDDGVINLADLIPDPVKAEAVRTYIKQYLTDRQVVMVDGPAPVYQFYDAGPANFAYSMDKVPSIYSRFLLQGQVFRAYTKSVDKAQAVYQYYSPSKGEFVLTRNANAGLSGYTNMGIVFYAFDKQVPGSVPIYEYYYEAKIHKKIYNTHYYSTSSTIPTPQQDWHYISIPFYAFQ